MNKGFTLMEVLAVVMVLALVGAMAVPSFRSVNADQKFRRARMAAVKVAQAIKSNYNRTALLPLNNTSFDGNNEESMVGNLTTDVVCDDNTQTGIPRRSLNAGLSSISFKTMFLCGSLLVQDFKGLPYRFTYELVENQPTIRVTALNGAGSKYFNENTSEGVSCVVSVTEPSSIQC